MSNNKKLLEQKYLLFISLLKSGPVRYDLEKIKRAWDFALNAHQDQKRLSGEPFFCHCIEAAMTLALWKLDEPSVISGLLHDVVEDTDKCLEEVRSNFGDDVATIVDGVSKISRIKLRGSHNREFVENLRKMFLSMARDLRVVLVKLADRLHNVKTLSYLPEEKQKKIAQETLEIYAPLAERLGMGQVKAELEDLAFPFVYPVEFEKVSLLSKSVYKEAESDLEAARREILKQLAYEGIKVSINTRKKHLYSLWKKLEREEINWDFAKIYDIVAMRILVDKIVDCYSTLGVVHSLYKPVPNIGISDFIAQPKPNGYRSIHTKVFGPAGRIIEIQVRTYKMHEQAEYGIGKQRLRIQKSL